MDLVSLGKPAILVPTPGQTEQEYLGKLLARHNWFQCIPQHKLSMKSILKVAERINSKIPELQEHDQLNNRIEHLLDLIKERRNGDK
jgi:UDP-N-acetylglucosamine:LPS N-acetylglucosamine transferase